MALLAMQAALRTRRRIVCVAPRLRRCKQLDSGQYGRRIVGLICSECRILIHW